MSDKVKEALEPVAWAVFTEDGYIRIWSVKGTDVEAVAKQCGRTMTPLYASPLPQAAQPVMESGLLSADDIDELADQCSSWFTPACSEQKERALDHRAFAQALLSRCELSVLAAHPLQDGDKDANRFTEDQIVAAARALADRNAEICNVNKEDNWAIYGNDFIEDAIAAIAAIEGGKP